MGTTSQNSYLTSEMQKEGGEQSFTNISMNKSIESANLKSIIEDINVAKIEDLNNYQYKTIDIRDNSQKMTIRVVEDGDESADLPKSNFSRRDLTTI